MIIDIKSLNRKKYQREVNKIVRNFNHQIEQDWLWNGRFVISQKAARFSTYEDHSGALFEVKLEMVDKKTGRTAHKWFDNYNIIYGMWDWGNACITEKWKVWSEDPNPNKQARLEGRKPPEWRA